MFFLSVNVLAFIFLNVELNIKGVNNSVHIVLRSIWTASNYWESFRVLYEPRTLRTPLISPYSPYSPNTPNTPNDLYTLNTSNNSSFLVNLKKLILTRRNAWGGLTLRTNRTPRIAQVVIRVERSEYLEWIEWIE